MPGSVQRGLSGRVTLPPVPSYIPAAAEPDTTFFCRRCQRTHLAPCKRCRCEHWQVPDDATPDTVPVRVACADCDRWHQPNRLGAGQSCCLRSIDTEHTCGHPTDPPSARTFCRSCQAQVTAALMEMPELYVALYLALSPGRSGQSEVRSSGFESVVPIVVAASDLMAEMAGSAGGAWTSPPGEFRGRVDPRGVLPALEDDLRTALGFSSRIARRPRPLTPQEEGWARRAQAAAEATYRRQTPAGHQRALSDWAEATRRLIQIRGVDAATVEGQAGPTLGAACEFLRVHVSSLLAVRPDAGDEVLRLRYRALLVLRRDEAGEDEDLNDAPCPTCDRRDLYRENGTDRVRCGSGRRCPELTWSEYQMLTWREQGWAAK